MSVPSIQRVVMFHPSDCDIVENVIEEHNLDKNAFSAALAIIVHEWAMYRGLPIKADRESEEDEAFSDFIHPPFP